MQLKLYTKEAQSGHITYKDEEKAYMCDAYSFNWSLTAITITITIAAIFMSCKVLQFLLKAESKRPEVNRAVFFSFGIVAFFVNIADVCFLVHAVYIECIEINDEKRITDHTVLSHVVIKVLELVVGVVGIAVFILVFFIGLCCSKDLPQPHLHVCTSPSSSATKYCCFAYKCASFFFFSNFFYFAYMVGLNVLPTFLMLFIMPIETLSVLVFYVSLLSSCVMVMTNITYEIDSEIHKSAEARDNTKKCITIIFSAISYFSVLISIVLLVVVFLFILAETTNSNTPYLATVIISLCSTILAVLGGCFTQYILSEKDKSDKESGSHPQTSSEKDKSDEESGSQDTSTATENTPLVNRS